MYTLEGVLVVSGRQGFRHAQVTLKQILLKYTKEKGFAANFTDFKVLELAQLIEWNNKFL